MTDDEAMTNAEWEEMRRVFGDADAQHGVLREDATVPVYDLEERCARFGESAIDFCKALPRGPLTNRIIDQLVGAATSVGANYCEADDAVSKKEFIVKVGTSRKEAREAKHFLRMAARAVPEQSAAARPLWLEARSLHLIFSKIYRSAKTP